jgi:hypothetical protein
VAASTGGVQVLLKVDGVSLGYLQSFTANSRSLCLGSFERKNGMQKMTAMQFNIAQVKHEGGTSNMLTGKVEALFYKLGALEYVAAKDLATPILTGAGKLEGKKCVVSKNGSAVLDDKRFNSKQSATHTQYKRGDFICTVTLNYCTAVGLIVNKILDAPSDNDDDSVEEYDMPSSTAAGNDEIDLTGDDDEDAFV